MGWSSNLIVYRHSRAQSIWATHNRMQVLQLYPTIENSFIRNVQRRMEFGIVKFPSEQATPTTPIKPHAQLSPQGSQINSDVPDYSQRYTNDIRKLQFPKDLQFHYDNRSVTINFGPYHLYMHD
jgi:hypothetical protein